MTEIERYEAPAPARFTPAAAPVLPPATDTDSWIAVLHQVGELAAQIAHTDFVPRALQGKPAAIAAAILAGREMGVGPMTSLQNLNVIQGRPGQSAILMRALVLSKGHQIEYVETTDTRAIVRGRRVGEQDWTEVTFTADQARKARIDLGGYPEDKLIARATSRLCRRKFADVISGLSYTLEELQDGDVEFTVGEAVPEPTPAAEKPARTAQRRTAKRPAATPAERPAPVPAAAPLAGPPLPGEDGYDQPATEAATEPERLDPNGKATAAQNRHMHALFNEAGIGNKEHREDRLTLTGLLLNRQIDTSAGLTVADAQSLIDALINLQSSGHAEGLAGAASDLLNEHELAELERQRAEQEHADKPGAEQ
ncbi:MAG: hypothetical protein L0H84_15145 [Pseudonocardia sp.]|nr:hypothetical protein [Pseudonocardia sp.]